MRLKRPSNPEHSHFNVKCLFEGLSFHHNHFLAEADVDDRIPRHREEYDNKVAETLFQLREESLSLSFCSPHPISALGPFLRTLQTFISTAPGGVGPLARSVPDRRGQLDDVIKIALFFGFLPAALAKKLAGKPA